MLDPLTLISLAAAASKLIQEAIPAIREMFDKGQIPVEKQAEVRAAYDSLRAQVGGEFTGPAWEVSGR